MPCTSHQPSLCRPLGRWKVLREPESARRYCGTAVSFVSFCLKTVTLPPNRVPTRFTDIQRTTLEDYRQYLTTSPVSSSDDVERFQTVLHRVLFREQVLDIDTVGRLACPVQSYIALLSLRRTGHFVQAGLVTQPISRLMYLSRGVVLKAAISGHNHDEGFIR
jgi:hypothetical protein